MIEELDVAGQLLSSALDKYLSVCLSFQNCYFGTTSSATELLEFSSHIAAQGQLVAALELKLLKAKNAINQVHNRSASLVPIHALPPELIERIFQYLVVIAQPMEPRLDLNGHPAVVAYVCSRWRKVALGLPWLWRYINIPLIDRNADVVPMNRGLAFAKRTNSLPLDILFYTEGGSRETSLPSKPEHRKAIIDTIAPRTRSLELVFNSAVDFTRNRYRFLSEYVEHCALGTLGTLVTSYRDLEEDSTPVFVDTPWTLPEYLHKCRAFSYVILGPALESLTVLRLYGVYPLWTSKAYHGLVELRLPSPGSSGNPSISEEHLQGILKASPALRILQFSIGIADPLPTDAEVVPIPLDHLEVLNVAGIELRILGDFLRWLSPGPKPLQFAISGEPPRNGGKLYSYRSGVESFFLRSNVTRIYAERDSYQNIFTLLRYCPRLNALAWHQISPYDMSESKYHPFPISHPCLESLFIGRSVVYQKQLYNLIGESSTLKRLLFSNTSHEPGFLDKLKSRSGIPDVRQVDYDPARDRWEGMDSWIHD